MPPWVSPALRVRMLITPLTALAPHSAPPGPLMTSMRSMFSGSTNWSSQYMPEKIGEYTLRPSISTSSLFGKFCASLLPLKPRAVTM